MFGYVGGRHGVHVIRPKRQGYLSELGTIAAPIDLNRVDIVNQEPSQCNLT